MLDAEEQWDEAACSHNKSPETVLADDFWGTAPDGTTYGKAEEVKDTQDPSKSARQCHQIDPRVRIFGENLAMVYGKAFSVRKGKDGRDAPRCLTFTDTWLKRDGKWQVIAAHDAQISCGE
ncbi:MAG: nuclear transport factor 2 family protein [Acidobacteriia bacterium]|nr:nuclear transport factor 2 family protein [Terriglobia bacterium]